MQNLRNCPKHLIILVVLFLRAISVQAQHSNAILTNANNGVVATPHAVAAAFTVSQKSGKIFVSNGATKTVVAPTLNNSQALVGAGHVFYINNAVSNKMVIKAYNVANNATSDVVKAEDLNSGRATDKKITNIVFDNVSNRLYFSTVSVNAQGYSNYLTWWFNPATNEIKLFADGKVKSVDNNGNVSSDMYGVDPQGTYVQNHVFSMDGRHGSMGARSYTISSPTSSSTH